MGYCKRRGYCCQDIRLAEPPYVLRRAYEYWRDMKVIDPKFSDIYLIYPMLEFKFDNQKADLPYHYKCKHFTRDESGIPTCSIYDVRPAMCRDFPYYDDVKSLDRDEPLSPYEGCGYNEDA